MNAGSKSMILIVVIAIGLIFVTHQNGNSEKITSISPSDSLQTNTTETYGNSSAKDDQSTNSVYLDPADYDSHGNYKPVSKMTPEEIKQEAQQIVEDHLSGKSP